MSEKSYFASVRHLLTPQLEQSKRAAAAAKDRAIHLRKRADELDREASDEEARTSQIAAALDHAAANEHSAT